MYGTISYKTIIFLKTHFKVSTSPALFLLLFISIILSSCNSLKEENEATPDYFFSFKKYFKSQAEDLNLKHIRIKKTISREGSKEEKIISLLDWEKELKLFTDADLNKKAWVDLYKVDTLKNDSLTTVSYKSKDSTLQVKEAIVIFKNNAVDEIIISSSFKNFYYESHLHLDYKTGVGYEIKGEQAIRFARKQDFEIECVFLN